MSDTEELQDLQPSDETYDAIDSLLSGDTSDAGADKGEDQTTSPESSDAASEDTQDIPEKDEAEEPEGDLETDDEEEEEDEVEEIDYDLMVPMADGRDAIKLGDMKDMVNDIERSKSDVDGQRMALIKQETELNQYMQQMNIQVPPEFQQHMAKQQHDYLESQHSLMMRMMPELKDKGTFDTMRKDIVEVAKASNFSVEEISQVADARIIHLLNRLSVFEAKEKAAQETVKQIKKKSGPKGIVRRNVGKGSKADKQFNDALKSNDQGVKDKAIEALLG